MKKLLWLLPLAMLIACGSATTELVPPETNAEANTAVTTTTDTTDTAESTEAETAAEPATAADLAEFQPATSIPEAAVVRAQDWREGSAEPLIVIIEYGDFQ